MHGYQRPEVLTQVAAIRRYIETDDSPLLPDAIVIAFDERVRFEPRRPIRAVRRMCRATPS